MSSVHTNPDSLPNPLPEMEVRDVHFSYGSTPVLDGISFFVQPGKVTTILGGNGCGKSTLFGLMTKNLVPKSGKVFLRGRNIAGMSLKDFSRQVSIVHQHNSASDDITVEQLIQMGRTPYKKMFAANSEEDDRLVSWAMEVTDVAPFAQRELSRLSGGQLQRVWIAMALAQNTKVLFLDEPTTFLDVRYQVETLDIVRKLNREFNITVVMVLHEINQAIHYSDVIVGLCDGKVAFQGDPQEVITSESIYELFGVQMDVETVNGSKTVLLRDACSNATPALPLREQEKAE